MGSKLDKYLSTVNAAQSRYDVRQEEDRLARSEDILKRRERMLGSDEQRAGYDVTQEQLDATRRYTYDAGIVDAVGLGKSRKKPTATDYLTGEQLQTYVYEPRAKDRLAQINAMREESGQEAFGSLDEVTSDDAIALGWDPDDKQKLNRGTGKAFGKGSQTAEFSALSAAEQKEWVSTRSAEAGFGDDKKFRKHLTEKQQFEIGILEYKDFDIMRGSMPGDPSNLVGGTRGDQVYLSEMVPGVVDGANQMLDQADVLEASGDIEGANALRQQAADHVRNFNPAGAGLEAETMRGAIGLDAGDPELEAKLGLTGDMATSVGEHVRLGKEYMDPDSEASRDFKDTLTAGALSELERGTTEATRTIGATARSARRAQRDIGLSRGSGYSATAQAAIAGRTSERFSAQQAGLDYASAKGRAEVISNADAYFQNFAHTWSVNAVAEGQAFLQNAGGIRDSFNNALTSLTNLAGQFSLSSAANMVSFAGLSLQDELTPGFEDQLFGTLIGASIGIGGGILGEVGAKVLGDY